jgi:hypothetical protein
MKKKIPLIIFMGSCSNDDFKASTLIPKNCTPCWFIRATQRGQMKIILTYNCLIEGESQDPKAIETQENKALEMETKDHLQLVATSYVPPALQKVFSK